MKKLLLLLLFACSAFSFQGNEIHASYQGLDEYSNPLISLTLNEDNSYVYKESFLDGSELYDTGEWKISKEILVLESSRKTQRVHQSQTFEKSYKFKGEKFLVKEDRLEYLWTNRRDKNQYLIKYTLQKRGA